MFHSLPARLSQQLSFIVECDKLKNVLRQSKVMFDDRRENSAEHSWHLALIAMTLAEYAKTPIDVAKVMKLCLVHDLVEIYCGDVFVYDDKAREAQMELEHAAAEKLFSLLPPDQAKEFTALWLEFENKQTPESQFAGAVDRLEPILANLKNNGGTWIQHGIRKEQVLAKVAGATLAAPEIAKAIETLLNEFEWPSVTIKNSL